LLNSKLDTLREEDDFSNAFFENYDMVERPSSIQYNVLTSLIEQAKNEGIFVTENNSHRQSPIHSYYEEAMELIRTRSARSEIQPRVPFSDAENWTAAEEGRGYGDEYEPPMKTVDLKANKTVDADGGGEEDGENVNRSGLLPPLLARVDEEGRSSVMSTVSTASGSAAYLPRIDSRYLPK
jgi:hypothetical protein